MENLTFVKAKFCAHALALFASASLHAATSFETTYASLISIPGYTSSETLENFPVLVKISENSPEGFHYDDVRDGGTDILFTDADGNELAHEIEKWDADGTSLIWVNLPTLQQGTMFRFCYGNSEIKTAVNKPSDVWSPAGYAGVWHLGESAPNGTETSADSTANGNTATPGGKNTAQMVGTDGIVGGARTIASTQIVNYMSIAHDASLDVGAVFTVSCWLKASYIGGNGRIIEKKGGNWANPGWEQQWCNSSIAAPQMTLRGATSDNNGKNIVELGTSLANWTQVTFVYGEEQILVYCNGEYVGQSPITKSASNSSYPLRFGTQTAYVGAYDEVRLLGTALSGDRIKAGYDTIASAGFLSMGKVVSANDHNTFTVEAIGEMRGTVTPAWGTTENLQPGEVAFSAPSGTLPTASETNCFKFTGYTLYVTSNGVERLFAKSSSLSGTYRHVDGQCARLVWTTVDMPQIKVTPTEGGSVSGTGYLELGSLATITAVPAAGYRFLCWSGTLPAGVSSRDQTLEFIVDGAYDFTAVFAVKPVTAAFFSWSGHAEGETVSTEAAANDIGTESFVPTEVTQRKVGYAAPAFSRRHPAATIYTDSTRTKVQAKNPGSVFFAPDGAGDINFASLGGWITRQSNCTVEFFLETSESSQYRGVLSMTHDGDQSVIYAPGSGDGCIRYSVEGSDSGHKGYVEGTTAAHGATSRCCESWQHVALVYDAAEQTVTIYRNYGTGLAKAIQIVSTSGNVPLYLGSSYARGGTTSNPFAGWVSCLRVTQGKLTPDDFLRAGSGDGTADGTVTFYDFRGESGVCATNALPAVGDAYSARVLTGSVENAPIYTNDIPDTAVFANAADAAAKKVLSKKLASVYFNGASGSYLMFTGLSSALAACDDFTLEMFIKPLSTSTWKAAVTWNDVGAIYSAKPFEVQIPGQSASSMRMQLNCANAYSDKKFSANLADGNWHHLAVVRSAETGIYTLYYDYTAVVTLNSDTKYPHQETFAPLMLGAMFGNAEQFPGMITALRISNRALDTEDFLVAAKAPKLGITVFVR